MFAYFNLQLPDGTFYKITKDNKDFDFNEFEDMLIDNGFKYLDWNWLLGMIKSGEIWDFGWLADGNDGSILRIKRKTDCLDNPVLNN